MKLSLTYGAASGVGRALLLLGLFFFGLHSDATALVTAQRIGMYGSALVMLACLHLALRARLAEVPAMEEFGFGRAFGTGMLVAFFGAAFSAVTNFAYFRFISPGLADLLVRAQVLQMEEAGAPTAQVEQMEAVLRAKLGPEAQALAGFLDALVVGALLALIVAAYSRRPATDAPPVAG